MGPNLSRRGRPGATQDQGATYPNNESSFGDEAVPVPAVPAVPPTKLHSCYLCGQVRGEAYQQLHAADEEDRSSLCNSCRKQYQLQRQQPGVETGQYPYEWCKGCGVLRSKLHHALAKSEMSIPSITKYCAQCIEHRETRRQMRKIRRESLIVESLDRKVQNQEMLREESQGRSKVQEVPARVDERKGRTYMHRSVGPSSLSHSSQTNETTTLANGSADVRPTPLGHEGYSTSESDSRGYSAEGRQHRRYPNETHRNRRRDRDMPMPRKKPDGISKLHWAALNASPPCGNEVDDGPERERSHQGASSPAASYSGDSLSTLSMEPMHLAVTDHLAQPKSQDNVPGGPNSAHDHGSSQDNTTHPSRPKRQQSPLVDSPISPLQPIDNIFSTSSTTTTNRVRGSSRNSNTTTPASTSPPTAPIAKGLSALFFSHNPEAEARMNHDLGFEPSPPPQTAPRRGKRHGRFGLVTAVSSESFHRRSTKSSHPPATTAEAFGVFGADTPFCYPGNDSNAPKPKRSKGLQFQYVEDEGGEESEGELFTPDADELAEAGERMRGNGGWGFGDGEVFSSLKGGLSQDGVVSRMSELDAMFAVDEDRAVEVGSELAWRIERHYEQNGWAVLE